MLTQSVDMDNSINSVPALQHNRMYLKSRVFFVLLVFFTFELKTSINNVFRNCPEERFQWGGFLPSIISFRSMLNSGTI